MIDSLKLENGILKEVGSNESDVFDCLSNPNFMLKFVAYLALWCWTVLLPLIAYGCFAFVPDFVAGDKNYTRPLEITSGFLKGRVKIVSHSSLGLPRLHV